MWETTVVYKGLNVKYLKMTNKVRIYSRAMHYQAPEIEQAFDDLLDMLSTVKALDKKAKESIYLKMKLELGAELLT